MELHDVELLPQRCFFLYKKYSESSQKKELCHGIYLIMHESHISKISMKIRLVTLFVIGWMMPSFCFSHVPSVFDSWLVMNSIIICLTSNVWITVYVVVHNKRDEEVITSLHDDSTAYPHSHGLDNDWCGKE